MALPAKVLKSYSKDLTYENSRNCKINSFVNDDDFI